MKEDREDLLRHKAVEETVDQFDQLSKKERLTEKRDV